MARPRTRDWVKTNCLGCGTELERVLTDKDRAFCNQACYFRWLREKRPASEIRYRHSQGALLAELQRVANLLGHLPSMSEMETEGTIYPSIYQKRFPSWRMALACITDPQIPDTWNVQQISPEEGGWLTGFADGESCFRLARHGYAYTPIWGFQLRADDLPAAEAVRHILGLDSRPFSFWQRDSDRAKGINAGDAIRFYIRDIPTHVSRTIPFFDRFHLRSKKAREFEMFKAAVLLLSAHQGNLQTRRYPDELRAQLAQLKLDLESAKVYREPISAQTDL